MITGLAPKNGCEDEFLRSQMNLRMFRQPHTTVLKTRHREILTCTTTACRSDNLFFFFFARPLRLTWALGSAIWTASVSSIFSCHLKVFLCRESQKPHCVRPRQFSSSPSVDRSTELLSPPCNTSEILGRTSKVNTVQKVTFENANLRRQPSNVVWRRATIFAILS